MYNLCIIPRQCNSVFIVRYFSNKMAGYCPNSGSDDDALLSDAAACRLIMAHNGWVMGDDPLKNFAEQGNFSST